MLQIEYVPRDENNADLFTKNLSAPKFEKDVQMYCGTDEYDKQGNVLMSCLILEQGRVLMGVSLSCYSALWISHGAISLGAM